MSDLPDLGLGPHRQPADTEPLADPVELLNLVQAVCNACGWHTAPVESHGGGTSAVREWARVHRHNCPARYS